MPKGNPAGYLPSVKKKLKMKGATPYGGRTVPMPVTGGVGGKVKQTPSPFTRSGAKATEAYGQAKSTGGALGPKPFGGRKTKRRRRPKATVNFPGRG